MKRMKHMKADGRRSALSAHFSFQVSAFRFRPYHALHGKIRRAQ
jgi:hypothetical protein